MSDQEAGRKAAQDAIRQGQQAASKPWWSWQKKQANDAEADRLRKQQNQKK